MVFLEDLVGKVLLNVAQELVPYACVLGERALHVTDLAAPMIR